MIDAPILLLAWVAAGGAIGAGFFGGLWWTVRRAVASRHPELWIIGSWLLRMSTAMLGLYAISGAHWERALLSLLGFVIARWAVLRCTRPSAQNPIPLGMGGPPCGSVRTS
jgi:F1F0 ATPase subunit 2